MTEFNSILYDVENGVATITLNRPERMNAIDWVMPFEIRRAVEQANGDDSVKIIVITGAGNAFCSGYDLKIFAESERGSIYGSQKMPWDPYEDFKLMNQCTENFMSLWRSLKPTIAKINGPCVAGGSDIALCCDLIFMSDDAYIGYPPARLWGCPTTAMWVYRLGLERSKNMLLTGQLIPGKEAEKIGLITKSVPSDDLNEFVDSFIEKIITVPTNQLFFQKQLINNAYEMMGLHSTQRLSVFFDGMARHTPEGVAFQKRCEEVGFKKAVMERDWALKSKI